MVLDAETMAVLQRQDAPPLGATRAPRVLVIDDERSIRELLQAGLDDYGFEVRTTSRGEDGLRELAGWRPDAILLDLVIPGENGLDLLERLTATTHAAIVVVSGKAGASDKVEALRSGADDYVAKPFSMAELALRLDRLVGRRDAGSPAVLRYDDVIIDLERHEVLSNHVPIPLTVREFDVLLALVRHAGRVLSREALLRTVWGDAAVAPGIVDTYVSYIRRKVRRITRRPLIRTVRGVGYAVRLL
jgi:two-component system OmpR family response regulator